jgi:hypothetical protein
MLSIVGSRGYSFVPQKTDISPLTFPFNISVVAKHSYVDNKLMFIYNRLLRLSV